MIQSKIGFIIVNSETGGMQTYLLRLLPLLPAGTQAVVFIRADHPGLLHDAFVASGATLVYGSFGYAHPVRLIRLYRRMRTERLDGLVDLTGVFSGMVLALAWLAAIPRRVVFHRRSSYAFRPTRMRRGFARFSLALAERFATAILANSQTALHHFHGRLWGRDSRLAVIPNIIASGDMTPKRPRAAVRAALVLPVDAIVMLHVGRVDPAKDHATLLRAMVRATAADPRLFAVLAGPGTEQLPCNLAGLIPPGLAHRFRVLGNRRDIADLNHAADLFVFTSITEGQPNALLEAMLCGLPVVASDIVPIRDVVPERGHDYLVRPGDVDGFTAAIAACMQDAGSADARRYRAEAHQLTSPETVLPRLFSLILPE